MQRNKGRTLKRERPRALNTPHTRQKPKKKLVLVHHIHLANNYSTRRDHRSDNQRKIQFTELPLANMNTLLPQYVPPEQPSQRRAYRKRERAVVGTDRKGVDGGIALLGVERVAHPGNPNLENSSGEDRGPDVRSAYLTQRSGGDARSRERRLTLHKIHVMIPIPAVTPTTPVWDAHHAHPFANNSTQPFLVRP